MAAKRSDFAIAELSGFVYAIGGHGGVNSPFLCSVERLDIAATSKGWSKAGVTALPARLRNHAAATLNDTIVVAGGEREAKVASKATWLMRLGDKGETFWRKGPELNLARQRHGLVAVNGSVYAIGGTSLTKGVEVTVERLGPAMDKWELLEQKLSLPAIGSSFTTI